MVRPRYGFQLCETYRGDLPRRCLAEEKHDGFLFLGQDGRWISRRLNDSTAYFPEVPPPTRSVVLGEMVVLGPNGHADFELILRRKTTHPFKVRYLQEHLPALFIAFDLLEHQGEPLVHLPQEERLRRLGELDLHERHAVPQRWPVSTDEEVQALLTKVTEAGAEGLVLKDLAAPYHGNRTKAWRKAKRWETEEFPIDAWERSDKGAVLVHITVDGNDQRVVVADPRRAAKVAAGEARQVQVRYFAKTEEGLRQPSVKAVW